jgi:hypothetical protein
MFGRRFWSLVILTGALTLVARAGNSSAEKYPLSLVQDEEALKNAGIATDGPSLLDYFRRRTPNGQEQLALKQRAAQLGSSIFSARIKATDDLIRLGRPALPYLREIAKKSDAETARRAQYAIGAIEQNTRLGLAAPASRVLVARNPPGALETLLAYSPFIDEGWVEDEIRQSMKHLAFRGGKAVPALEQALVAKDAKLRAAATWIVGRSSDPKQRQLVMQRLTDESSEVRFLAASSLLAAREPVCVPTLISLLGADSPELAARAEDLLFCLAGENGPPIWLDAGNDNSGKKVQGAWEAWWRKNETKFDWKALYLDEQPLGLTLIVENQRPDGGSRIYETNKKNEVRWQIKITNPIDAQWLPGGRLLVGDSRDSVIYEIDTRGNKGWQHTGVAPTSIQRLPNGNTVVSTYQNILEITRDGKTIFTYTTPGHTYHARKLADGHYVWIDACGEIGEVNEHGKLIAKARVGSGLSWGSIERLRNGRYLVALGGAGKVQELDMTGKVYWDKPVSNPNRAIRLRNGHTLVASHGDQAIYEFDGTGNERWKHPCVGRPFAAHRR